jgi:hypothetical protein
MPEKPAENVNVELPLPEALRAMLAKARVELKTKKKATIEIGPSEARGIYALSTAVDDARKARDKLRKQLQEQNKLLEQARKEARDQNLLNNRAVVSLLIEVERILSGEVRDDGALRAVHARVAGFVRRSALGDRRKTAQKRSLRTR